MTDRAATATLDGQNRPFRGWVAAALAMLLVFAGFVVFPSAAHAAIHDITVNTGVVDGQVVKADGASTHKLKIQYPENVGANYRLVIDLPEYVTIPSIVPSGNAGVQSITREGDSVVITFDETGRNDQGVL